MSDSNGQKLLTDDWKKAPVFHWVGFLGALCGIAGLLVAVFSGWLAFIVWCWRFILG